jgi:acetolactate synthase I/II/III large subunit
MSTADEMLRTAVAASIEVCFANPGTTELAWVAALDRSPRMRPVLCLFEGVCTGAADGYGRMRGTPALTLLHLGPGFANGIANLHNARRARTPVVNVIGDHASWHLAADAPLASDIESLARPVSGWLRSTKGPDTAIADMAEAIAAAGRTPGLVSTLIVPADHAAAETARATVRVAIADTPRVPGARVDAAARTLHAAGGGSTLLLGGNALGERGLSAAARVAAASGARLVLETFPARWERGGNLPEPARLPYLPEQATELLARDALVLLAGARSPVAFFGYPGQPSEIAPATPRGLLAAPDEDAALALEQLAEALDAPRTLPATPARERPAPPSGRLDVLKLGALLAARLPEGAVVVDESATSGLGFYLHSAASPRHTVLSLTGGAIGQGPPCATGAALACPDRVVIDFQADGSAAYTLQALWSQAREGLHVITLLCANRAYRILQIELARAGVAEPGPKARALTSLDGPTLDWVALARGFGAAAERVETVEALDTALGRALAARGPTLLEVAL